MLTHLPVVAEVALPWYNIGPVADSTCTWTRGARAAGQLRTLTPRPEPSQTRIGFGLDSKTPRGGVGVGVGGGVGVGVGVGGVLPLAG